MKNLLIITITALLACANVAHAGPDSSKFGKMTDAEKTEHMQKRLDRMATKLSLSDEQKIEIQALKQTSMAEIKPLFIEQRALEKEIRELDIGAIDYTETLADAANRQAEITRQLVVAKGNQRQAIASILTEEQLALKNEMKKNRKGRRS